MIEKRTVWAVTSEYAVVPKTVIMEDGRLLCAKNPDAEDTMYDGNEFGVRHYAATEQEARQWIEERERSVRDMAPRVRKFLDQMYYDSAIRQRTGIEKKDYLGSYAADCDCTSSRGDWYDKEQEYTKQLETYIKSGMLTIDGYMLPASEVRRIKWYGHSGAEEYEPDEWQAELTTADGHTCKTDSANEVRLIWAVFGKTYDRGYYVDDDIDYDKSE